MTIRRILVPLSGRHDPEDPASLDAPALQAALAVGARHEAHVEVLCVTAAPGQPEAEWSAWLPGYGIHELIRWTEQENEERRRRAKAAFDRAVAALPVQPPLTDDPASGFSARFTEAAGGIARTVGAAGRLSDLIVTANSRAGWEAPFRPILEASLRGTGRPLLVSPPQPAASFASRVALAWNDSVESARALAAGLELMTAAEQVRVICCRESDSVAPQPEPLLEYLAAHGVEAEASELEATPRETPGAIVAAAEAAGSDLLVLGAYLHSRAHSLLYGSVTEFVLSDPKLPALLVP